MKLFQIIKDNLLAILFLILILLVIKDYYSHKESFTIDIDNSLSITERVNKYNNLMKDFNTIFPDRNRNAGGPQFFKHIVDMNLKKNDFELYNSFYCGVSGSPIDPKRSSKGKISDYVIVKDLNGNDIYGKYYRCCSPCLCDIMKYARVDKYEANLKDKCVIYDVLTIQDPCCNDINIHQSVSSFQCKNGKTENGVYSRNGRLIFALFYDTKIATDSDRKNISDVKEICKERMNTEPDNLQGGMGDIFVKLSLACEDNKEKHNELKNIYGEPLQTCKTGSKPGSWDGDGYCSEKGGGVHQICMNVTEDRSDFSNETGQGPWSKDRVGNNHCMCLGAWALYKAKGKGDGNELVCDSIPDMSLDPSYVKKWNTWNGNEYLKKDGKPNDQIIDGVDSLVKQCYDKKNSEYLKNKYDTLRRIYDNWPSII
tara:strand:- start:2107 stop:3384 length:1278 start_codon:yes stop_codon:yes gene_type:complete